MFAAVPFTVAVCDAADCGAAALFAAVGAAADCGVTEPDAIVPDALFLKK
jgi:hypothetical protein